MRLAAKNGKTQAECGCAQREDAFVEGPCTFAFGIDQDLPLVKILLTRERRGAGHFSNVSLASAARLPLQRSFRGNTGTVAACRAFLLKLDLTPFGNPSTFAVALEGETEKLLAALPTGARHLGIARKVLNIFLRDCLYTTYLDEAFHLRRSEALFEIPLDSLTATQLKRGAGRGRSLGGRE